MAVYGIVISMKWSSMKIWTCNAIMKQKLLMDLLDTMVLLVIYHMHM